jgi:hypothetical protein
MGLRTDPEENWMQDLPKRMFLNDAIWFISHPQSMYMAVCTPSDPSDEFILTDDSYNVFEGPNYFAADEPESSKEQLILPSTSSPPYHQS